MQIPKLVLTTTQLLNKHAPTIFSTLGCLGMVGAVAVTAKQAPIAKEKIEIAEEESARELTLIEDIRLTYREWIPIVSISAASIGCVMAANAINLRRIAIISSAYLLKDTDFKEYKDKVSEMFGKGKEKKVEDALKQEALDNSKYLDWLVEYTGEGNVLFYDNVAKRYFLSSTEAIKRHQNEVNARLLETNWISWNDILEILHISPIKGCAGDELGYNYGYSGMFDFGVDSFIGPNNDPCGYIDYDVRPKHLYY